MVDLQKMDWKKLLSEKRLGKDNSQQNQELEYPRSPFQKDYDRIAFCSAFRRLQDKTQVIPLSESDYPRTRLTHSIEVASVGHSLGINAEKIINEKYEDVVKIPGSISSIVEAACLAHDIGNPPFGHSGEDAFRQWFQFSEIGKRTLDKLRKKQRTDFTIFEGNAQSFSILTRLQHPKTTGGLQLTCATLGALSKYPWPSSSVSAEKKNKHGFFQADKENFEAVANELGLLWQNDEKKWCRHPLAHLVEAADDICYLIDDLEDAFLLDNISFKDTKRCLKGIVLDLPQNLEELIKEQEKEQKAQIVRDKNLEQEIIEYFRALAIGILIDKVAKCFKENLDDILKGKFESGLIKETALKGAIDEIKNLSKTHAYKNKSTLKVETPGFQVIGGLLDILVPATINTNLGSIKSDSRDEFKNIKLREFMNEFLEIKIDENCTDDYKNLLKVTDFISGATDSYVVSTYKTLTGMSLRIS